MFLEEVVFLVENLVALSKRRLTPPTRFLHPNQNVELHLVNPDFNFPPNPVSFDPICFQTFLQV